jgi:hypothetical protein
MKATLLILATLLAASLAGCMGSDTNPGPEPGPQPEPARPYSTFRCADNTTYADNTNPINRCNVLVTRQAPRNNGPANELTVAVDPTNPLRLIAGGKDYTLGKDANCGENRVWAGYYWSHDGGYTWGNDLMPGHDQPATSQSSSPLAGYHCTTDPVAYWDGKGNAWYSGLSYAQSSTNNLDVGSNIWMAKSTDGGKTYPNIYLAAQGDGATVFHDKQWFTIDHKSGAMYLTWSMFAFIGPFGTDQIVFERSTDNGVTWTPPRVLYETQRQNGIATPAPELFKQFSMPQLDKDGNIYVIWMGNGDIWFTTSTNQGNTWTDARPIVRNVPELSSPLPNTAFRVSTYPVLGIDRSDGPGSGNLYITYSAKNGTDTSDVFLVMSKDKGQTWSAPLRVNDDDTKTDQFMPWLDVGPKGDVHILFYDRRDDPKNTLIHAYYAHFVNNTLDPNIRLSEVPINATLSYHQNGAEFIGDYLGIMEGTNGWVHPVWVDTRNGGADVYTTVITRS